MSLQCTEANKGEAHHALKRAISFHRRGEIRDRSGEGQHYRIAGMNLLAAIIIFWNTMKLGEVVNTRAASGTHIAPDLLAHVSPLGKRGLRAALRNAHSPG